MSAPEYRDRAAVLKYFAYGSNLCTRRLTDRVPSTRFQAVATLHGFQLSFARGRALDGSGKCNVFETGCENDVVYGALFDIALEEKAALDEIEGAGYGYAPIEVQIVVAGCEASAYTYVTPQGSRHDTLAPYDWYRDLVLSGAKHFQFPSLYLKALEDVETQRDPDTQRAEREFRYTRV